MSSTAASGPSFKRKESMVSREEDQLIITPLGAGSEVGRSCVYMTYKNKTVLFDCGIHLAYSGMAALPYFDEIDPSRIDVVLVTHFHLDHSASLPYFLEKTTFKGRVFMTHATKAIYKLLVSDYVKVSKVSVKDMLFDEQDIFRSMDKIEVIDFHQTLEVNGIRFWCYTAGHVLGAAMFMVDIAGVRVLYTGDYSRDEDRHLRAAETPQFSPDVCIIESTYGVQIHQPRAIREKRFTDVIHNVVSQGGRVLIPAFALGRAQELLLILDEYWAAHPELHSVPIYYASPLAKKCMAVYQTYINAMNDRIRAQFEGSNPFDFKHIMPLKSIENFEDDGPSVVMASPGGLQSGLSRQLFDIWCQDRKNACIIPGYVVEGTLAKTIMNEPKEVTLMNGLQAPLNMQVHYISFSAHADFSQTSAFLNELRPPNIILVHGEANEMGRLKQKLLTQFADQNIRVLSPKNCQAVEMHFNAEKTAKAIGRLAEKTPKVGSQVSGLLVRKGFTYQIMPPEDLHVFTQLLTGTITQRLSIPYKGAFTVLRHRLQQLYEGVETLNEEVPTLKVHGKVLVKQEGMDYVVLQWVSDPITDMVSDSIIAMMMNFSPESPKMKTSDVESMEGKAVNTLKIVQSFLVSLFGDVKELEGKLIVSVDGVVAIVDYTSNTVDCENENLRERIKAALRRMETADDFKVHFHDRHGDFYCWLNTTMMENRQILNTTDLDGFDKRKLPCPGFQVEVVVMDYDAPVPSKSRGGTVTGMISPSVLEGRPTQTSDSNEPIPSTEGNEGQEKDDIFSDSETEENGFSKMRRENVPHTEESGAVSSDSTERSKEPVVEKSNLVNITHGIESSCQVSSKNEPSPDETNASKEHIPNQKDTQGDSKSGKNQGDGSSSLETSYMQEAGKSDTVIASDFKAIAADASVFTFGDEEDYESD